MRRFPSPWPPILFAIVAGCGLPLDTRQRVPTLPIFDPSTGEIPMPNDALRDEAAGRLALPIEGELTAAEREFREWLNTRDGWSSALPATVRFSAAIDERTVDEDSVQVWDWTGVPRRIEGLRRRVDEAGRRLSILPPRTGWERGHRYVVVVRGGDEGVRDAQGFGVVPDAIFYFLRRTERLDTLGHNRAFPGPTRAQRLLNGARLEALRVALAPFFEFFEDPARPEASTIPRDEVAALWSFTVTRDPELAMDRDSQRMPLPFDLLIDPDTGRISLPAAEWDTELERDAKRQLSELDGFGVSANLWFETTEAVDPRSVPGHIHVFELGPRTTRELPIVVRVLGQHGEAACRTSPVPSDCVHVLIEIDESERPLPPQSTYAVVVDRALRSASERAFEPMPIGHFLRARSPIAVDGRSQVRSIPDPLARRLEGVRRKVADFLDDYGRERVVTAWPFTTMNAVPAIAAAARTASELGLEVRPTVRERLPPLRALEALFPGPESAAIRTIYLPRTAGVREFVVGELPTPSFLDPVSRRWREDGLYDLRPVRFYLAVPEDLDPSRPAPVVIFGHALVTDARFVMTIAGELARRGFVTIGVDFPFHGDRIVCVDASLVGVPNYFPGPVRTITGLTDEILRMPPCRSGPSARCSADGRCLTSDGRPDEFSQFPFIAVQPASGAAFLDTRDLPFIPDHFRQALVDLGTVLHAVRTADWNRAIGISLDRERILYAGQSLGAIVGAVWVSVTPEIARAVLNVPGADLVDLFVESTYFGPQIEAYFDELGVPNPSYDRERLLDAARWLIDSVDPHSVAHLYAEADRPVLIQMSRGDLVIPNRTTEVLARVSGRPVRVYPSPFHGDLVAPVAGDAMLRDLADFLAGDIDR